jgi:hypothetical protein
MLKPLSSRKTAINSLGIDYNYSPCSDYVHKDDLKDFNMESLEELVLKGLSCEEAEAILDLALHSTCDEMKVGLDIHSIKPVLFEHSLIRRSAQLDISAPGQWIIKYSWEELTSTFKNWKGRYYHQVSIFLI